MGLLGRMQTLPFYLTMGSCNFLQLKFNTLNNYLATICMCTCDVQSVLQIILSPIKVNKSLQAKWMQLWEPMCGETLHWETIRGGQSLNYINQIWWGTGLAWFHSSLHEGSHYVAIVCSLRRLDLMMKFMQAVTEWSHTCKLLQDGLL